MFPRLDGLLVREVAFDFRAILRFKPRAELDLNTAVTIRSPDWELIVDPDPTFIGPGAHAFLALFNRQVVHSDLAPDGTLTIEFEGDHWLISPPDPDYEAWGYSHHDGTSVFASVGGGEPAIFPPVPAAPER